MTLQEYMEQVRVYKAEGLAYGILSGGADPARARELRKAVEAAATGLDDETALGAVELFPAWAPETAYQVGDRVRYRAPEEDSEGQVKLYRCVQAHTAQADWTPTLTPALWTRVEDPAEEWPDWVQPTGVQDAYPAGAQVSHQDKHWISQLEANVYEPGVYGWTEA